MGCVSSALLNQDDDFTQMGSTATALGLGHHIVSLTSTTYGLLTLDPLPSDPSPRPPIPEVINSWELMAGLDSTLLNDDSFRFSPAPLSPLSSSKRSTPKFFFSSNNSITHNDNDDRENSNPNHPPSARPKLILPVPGGSSKHPLDAFQELCPPNGENKAVLYTTTLRGVRNTFEACNAVRSTLQALGFAFSERDISMDCGFREELKQLMALASTDKKECVDLLVPPRLFVKGRYVGGADEVLRNHDQGELADLLQGLPKLKPGLLCDGCGGLGFLPCFHCHGSCKLVMLVKDHDIRQRQGRTVIMRCPDCNENGLVLCPICS